MKRSRRVLAALAVLTVSLVLAPLTSVAVAETGASVEYVVVFSNQRGIPDDADAKVKAAGGVIIERLPQVGAVAAVSANPAFDATMEATQGVRAVSPNVRMPLIPEDIRLTLDFVLPPPDDVEETHPTEPTGRDPQPMPDNLGNQQWDKMRMNATLTGSYAVQRGRRDVVVAVIDTGAEVLPQAHADIAPNLDYARSRSFVGPVGGVEGDPNPVAWDDRHGHGSWCLSAVGAPINGAGISGVAPNVTLVALKALSDAGLGSFLDVSEAIIYAGENHFDVISMSLGGYINHSEFNALWVLITRAIEFARARGVLPVAALANDNLDLSDGAIMRDEVEVPGEVPGVVGVSATGYYDQKAYYSNYGVGKTDVSAPGGDARTQFPPPTYRGLGRVLGAWATENTGGVVLREENCVGLEEGQACSTYGWVQGTSMATPNTAGVAALIISQYGDFTPDNGQKIHMAPTEVESILQITANNRPCPDPRTVEYPLFQTAACQGNAGYNGFYGKGIVDALKAVTEYPHKTTQG